MTTTKLLYRELTRKRDEAEKEFDGLMPFGDEAYFDLVPEEREAIGEAHGKLKAYSDALALLSRLPSRASRTR